jgi:hypothetical protein
VMQMETGTELIWLACGQAAAEWESGAQVPSTFFPPSHATHQNVFTGSWLSYCMHAFGFLVRLFVLLKWLALQELVLNGSLYFHFLVQATTWVTSSWWRRVS